MQEEAGSLLHNTTSHTKHFVSNFKILGTVVPEKYLTQIPICITWEREMEKEGKK